MRSDGDLCVFTTHVAQVGFRCFGKGVGALFEKPGWKTGGLASCLFRQKVTFYI